MSVSVKSDGCRAEFFQRSVFDFKTEISLSVLEIETYTTVYFAKEESFTRNVLGRGGWLDRVKLGLIDYEGKLFLSEYDK